MASAATRCSRPCLASAHMSTVRLRSAFPNNARHASTFLSRPPRISEYRLASVVLPRQSVLPRLGASREMHSSAVSFHQQQKGQSQPKRPPTTRPVKSAARQQTEKNVSTTSAPSTGAAVEAPSEAEPTTLQEKIKKLWATAKYLFRFYFNGVKQIWANRSKVAEIQKRVADGGSALTREESQLIRVHRADMKKLPLFLLILVVLEELLPLIVIWAPSLLPSTCILPNQLVKIRRKEEVKRSEAFAKLIEKDSIKQLMPLVGEQADGTATELQGGGQQDVLAKLNGETVSELAQLFSLSTFGGSALTRKRLIKHLDYLREDDKLMCQGGGYSFIPQNLDALARACGDRGLRSSDIPQPEMFETLRAWLRQTTRSPTSTSLPTSTLALLPLHLYNPAAMAKVREDLAAEEQRGLLDKTKDVLKEVVEEEKKVSGEKEAEGALSSRVVQATDQSPQKEKR